MTAMASTAVTPTIDNRVAQYVKLRDMIRDMEKAHTEKMQPYKDALDQLNGVLLNHLNQAGVESARTNSGTVYKTSRKSATIADQDAFMDHVIQNNSFELLDKRANSTAVEDYLNENKILPPGVNFTVTHLVGVRRG